MNLAGFRPVPGFPNYLCSPDGRIYSRPREHVIRHPGGLLKQSGANDGALQVTLSENGKKQRMNVGRVVLMTFVGPQPENCECCHNDGDFTNNCVGNLRWDTHKANVQDSIRHGTRFNVPRGEKHHTTRLTESQIRSIRASQEPQRILASRFGVKVDTISRIRRRVTWRHVK